MAACRSNKNYVLLLCVLMYSMQYSFIDAEYAEFKVSPSSKTLSCKEKFTSNFDQITIDHIIDKPVEHLCRCIITTNSSDGLELQIPGDGGWTSQATLKNTGHFVIIISRYICQAWEGQNGLGRNLTFESDINIKFSPDHSTGLISCGEINSENMTIPVRDMPKNRAHVVPAMIYVTVILVALVLVIVAVVLITRKKMKGYICVQDNPKDYSTVAQSEVFSNEIQNNNKVPVKKIPNNNLNSYHLNINTQTGDISKGKSNLDQVEYADIKIDELAPREVQVPSKDSSDLNYADLSLHDESNKQVNDIAELYAKPVKGK